MRLWRIVDLLDDGKDDNPKANGYEYCFKVQWRKRFREFLRLHPHNVEGAVTAEWARFCRREPSHWFGDADGDMTGSQHWETRDG